MLSDFSSQHREFFTTSVQSGTCTCILLIECVCEIEHIARGPLCAPKASANSLSDTLILKTRPTELAVLLPALSPALPAAMADDTSMGGHLATTERDPTRRHLPMIVPQRQSVQPSEATYRGVEPAVAVTCMVPPPLVGFASDRHRFQAA